LAKLAGIALSILLLSAVGFLPYHADAQTQTKYLSYENKQYGFSIKYPANWEKTEVLTKSSVFPNVLDIVTFSTPSKITSYGVSLIKDDTTFTGLSGQKFLDKVKEKFVDPICRRAPAGVTCSTELLQQQTLTHANGYSGYLTIFGIKISSDQGPIETAVVLGFYPDGNDVWIIAAASSSGEEFQQYTNELATIGSSFKIFNYKGEQTTTSQSSTIAKSSVGLLQINSGNFAASKYKPAELLVSGQINNPLQGVPLILKIIKPDKTSEEQNILVTKDGNFRAPIKIECSWPAGSYQLSAKYGTQDLGTVSFQVNMGDAKTTTPATQKQTTTTSQSKKYLSYENKKYGFSLKYPSDLKKEEKLEKSDEPFPNSISIVSFTTPSELSANGVILIKDDTIFKGLSGQKFLDKMKNEFKSRTCSAIPDPTVTCSMEVLDAQSATNKNGHLAYSGTYVFTISDNQNSQKLMMFVIMYPDGNDIWMLLLGTFQGEDYKGIGEETGKMADTFTISNYKGKQEPSSSTKSSTTQTPQSTKSLSYENKQYGFSINYPLNWEKDEKAENDSNFPEILSLVSLHDPSESANFMLGLVQDDKGKSQRILDQLKNVIGDNICSSMPAEVTCSWKVSEKSLTHKNGYGGKSTTLLVKISDGQMSTEMPAVVTLIPDGKNTWAMVYRVFTPDDPKQLFKDVASISESFKINNYQGSASQKQFSLDVKATQKNDVLEISVKNPIGSKIVYGIKLTTTNGKITNFLKLDGWEPKRINDKTVMYQTKSSPLDPAETIKIKLKVDSKKTEFSWEAFSKDQKSLGTGKVKP